MEMIDRRVTALETELKHLATKADLKDMEMRLIKWMVGMMVGSIAAAASIALLLQRLIG